MSILSDADPEPVERVNMSGASPFVLTCEHAGRVVPRILGDLGVAAAEMDRHIAYDIGAEGLSRAMSRQLDAPLIMQRYSRLVVDCNRPFDAPDCMPEISDGTSVPANLGLSAAERGRRFAEIHVPFHDAVGAFLDDRARRAEPTVLVSVHSFTPVLAGVSRPWHVGALSNRDDSFARRFLDVLTSAHPAIPAAYNQPYIVDDLSDYTIPVHGEGRRIPHLLLEIRNDQIAEPETQLAWAGLLSETLKRAAELEGEPRGT